MAAKSDKELHGKGPYIDDETEESKRRTNAATSQDQLEKPRIRRGDMPEADRKDFPQQCLFRTGHRRRPGAHQHGRGRYLRHGGEPAPGHHGQHHRYGARRRQHRPVFADVR